MAFNLEWSAGSVFQGAEETVQYVSNIYKYRVAYKLAIDINQGKKNAQGKKH